MMRRRAFFGGKKEPVYIFKEGTGFITNPLPGVTLDYSGGSYSTSRIALIPDSEGSTWWREHTIIGTESSWDIGAVNWKSAFPGYKKMFVEVANSSSTMGSYPLKVGLTEEYNTEDYVQWIQVKSYSSTERQIFEFDISNIANSIIVAFGGYHYSVAGEGRTTSSYIYNIWLE